jgi:hypothetical protein
MNPYHVAQYIHNVEALTELANAEDADGILAIINSKTITKTNSELQTINALTLTLGIETSAMAAGILDAAGASNPLLKAMYYKLCSTGIDFSDALTQGMIDAVFTGDYAALAAPLKAMGVWSISEAEVRFGRSLTIDDMTEVFIQYKRILLKESVFVRFNNLQAAIESGLVITEQEAITKFGE